MARGGQDLERPLGRGLAAKLLVVTPLALSAGCAAFLFALTPLSWGKADSAGLASWAPTVGLLLVCIPVLGMSLWGIRSLWRKMIGLYEVDVTWAVVGAIAHWLAAVSMVIFAGTATSSSSYDSLGVDSTSTAGYLFLVILFQAVFGGLLAGLTAAYVWAVTPGAQTRIGLRRDDEADFVDQWTRRRR